MSETDAPTEDHARAPGSDDLADVRPSATIPLSGNPPEPKPGSAASERASAWVGRILAGRYELERVVGRGGMGIVYAARHVTVGRPVAVKVLRHDLAQSTEAVARFHREAQAAAKIGNAHIVEVFDFGHTEDGDAFIVMELLAGDDLGCLVRRAGPLPEARCVEVARQIASALDAAHEKGIVHRDLKSENVFVVQRDGQDFVKVLDFGISKVVEAGARTTGERGPTTAEGVVMGTPHYMAPEQALGSLDVDHRIDLYALGCLLFEMLTGTLPFTGKNAVEVVFKHVHEPPPAPSRVRPGGDVSPALDAVVLRALAKDRDRRFATAAELAAALPAPTPVATSDAAFHTPMPAQTDARAPSVVRWRARVLLAGAVAVGGLVTELAWRHNLPERAAALRAGDFADAAPVPVEEPAVPALATRALAPPVAPAQPAPAAPDAGVDAGAAPAQVLTVIARPEAAQITVDGQAVTAGDFVGRFPRGSRHVVTAEADGWLPAVETVVLDRDRTLRLRLQRLSPARPARPARPPPVAARQGGDAGTDPRVVDAAPSRVPPAGLKQSPYGAR